MCRAQRLWLPYPSALRRMGVPPPRFRVRVTSAGTHSGILTYLGWSRLWGLVLWPRRRPLSWQEAHQRVLPGGGFGDFNSQAFYPFGGFPAGLLGTHILGDRTLLLPTQATAPRVTGSPPTLSFPADTGEQRPGAGSGDQPECAGPGPGLSARPPACSPPGNCHPKLLQA